LDLVWCCLRLGIRRCKFPCSKLDLGRESACSLLLQLLVVIFQCLPTRSIWERFDPVNPMPPTDYSCGVDLFKFYFGYAVVNTSTDIVIVLTPFPYIWKLHLPRAQKAAVMAIFALGTL